MRGNFHVRFGERGDETRRPQGRKVRLAPTLRSGSFLLGAYQFLLDYYLSWYLEHKDLRGFGNLGGLVRQIGDEWRLTIAEKKRILTTHIFGVDIDRQAVEVTKLSLLLKVLEGESTETLQMALPGFQERALPNLDNNIKCGNSLIGPDYFTGQLLPDADELRRVNPFDWEREFPDAIKAGGFDCIVGNPPYVRVGNVEEAFRPYLYRKYNVTHRFDIYIVFIQRAFELLSKPGLLGFIVPNKFFTADYGATLRKYLSSREAIWRIVDFGDSQVFKGATTYTCLLFLTQIPQEYLDYQSAFASEFAMAQQTSSAVRVDATKLGDAPWAFVDVKEAGLVDRLSPLPRLGTFCDIARGLETGWDDVFLLTVTSDVDLRGKVTVRSDAEPTPFKIERESIRPVVKGAVDVRRYSIEDKRRYLLFPYRHEGGKAYLINEDTLKGVYPLAWKYLMRHEKELRQRKGEQWYAFRRRNYDLLDGVSRLLVPSIAKRASFAGDPEGRYHFVGSGGGGGGGYGISVKPGVSVSIYYLLGILNSKLIDWNAKLINSRFGQGYYSFNRQYIEPLPIRPINFSDPADVARHDRMVTLVEQMLELHRRLAAAASEHDRALYQRQIEATDREIDKLVYELYGLTQEEIKIVEGE